MKNPGMFGMCRRAQGRAVVVLFLAALLVFCYGGVFAASDGHGEEGKAAQEAPADASGHGAAPDAHGEAGGHGEGGPGGKGWVSTDTYRVMNFGVLAIALFFLLAKTGRQGIERPD